MGRGYTLCCDECGYSLEYLEGIGFMYYREAEEILSDIKAGKYGNDFMKAANDAKKPIVNHSRELYKCMECGELQPDMEIELCDGENVLIRKQHACNKCNGEIFVVNSIENIICPKCGAPLVIMGILMWD